MLNIVTGKINSGKTTHIYNIYKENKIGDGFISIKNMKDNLVHSYDVLRLSTNKSKQLIIRDDFINKDQKVLFSIGPYNFLEDSFNEVVYKLRQMIKNQITPIYLDEIGLLELDNLGFHEIFQELIESNLEIFVVIRKDLIDSIIKKYKIKEYNIIT